MGAITEQLRDYYDAERPSVPCGCSCPGRMTSQPGGIRPASLSAHDRIRTAAVTDWPHDRLAA